MKKIFLVLLACLLLAGCSQANTKKQEEKYYCPVCGESVEFEVEPEDAIKWMRDNDYIVIYSDDNDEMHEFARDLYLGIPEYVEEDLLQDDAILDYLKSAGWTIVPPGGDYWERVPTNYTPVDESCVYWVKSGYAYHSTKDCVALKNSKEILHGTLKEAQASGHDHPCSKCIEP